jgi:hypothetical protein
MTILSSRLSVFSHLSAKPSAMAVATVSIRRSDVPVAIAGDCRDGTDNSCIRAAFASVAIMMALTSAPSDKGVLMASMTLMAPAFSGPMSPRR